MKKSLFSLIISLSIIFCSTLSAQDPISIQINGGMMDPISSSNGYIGSVQFNYSISSKVSLYAYSGYSAWGKYTEYFRDYTTNDHPIFNAYSANDHSLIPVYLGSRINFHTNSFFTAFVNFELGYSFISYNNYNIIQSIKPLTGETLSYTTDQNSKKRINESVFGVGIGGGLSRPLTNNLSLIITYKFNTYANSNYPGLLSTKGIYSAFLLGVNFNI